MPAVAPKRSNPIKSYGAMVYAMVQATPNGGTGDMPIHEVPLARRKIKTGEDYSADIEVLLSWPKVPLIDPDTGETMTDEDGRYRLAGLDELPVRVEASADGFVSDVLEEISPGRTDVDLTLRPTGGLTGRVVLEDGGVPEAFLIVSHIEAESSSASPERYAGFPRKETFTGEDGSYRIDDVPPGALDVFDGPDREVLHDADDAGFLVGLLDGRLLRRQVRLDVPLGDDDECGEPADGAVCCC